MTWSKIFTNPKPFLGAKLLRGETPLPTVRARVIATVATVDRHLSEAQQALSRLHDDVETRDMVHDIFNRLEDLRYHVQHIGKKRR